MISETLILGGIISIALGGNGGLLIVLGFLGALIRVAWKEDMKKSEENNNK